MCRTGCFGTVATIYWHTSYQEKTPAFWPAFAELFQSDLLRANAAGASIGAGGLTGFILVILQVVNGIVELLRSPVDIVLDFGSVEIDCDARFAVGILDAGKVVPVENPACEEEDYDAEKQEKHKISHGGLHSA